MSPQMIAAEMREIAAKVFITVAQFLGTNDEATIISFINLNDLK